MIKNLLIGCGIVFSFISFLLVFCQMTLNSAILKEELIYESYSNIEISLKKRKDAISQIIEVTSQISKHETNIVNSVTEARQFLQNGNDIEALKSINLIVEAYPDIKSSQNYLQLQNTISLVEQEIKNTRDNYTYQIKEYNKFIRIWPNRWILSFANYEKFEKAEYLNFKKEDLETIKNMFNN